MIFTIYLFLSLSLSPIMASELPEIAMQDVSIEFQGTKEGETSYSGDFIALDKEQFLVWLREYDRTNENQYSIDEYNCLHFSLDLRDHFYNDYGSYGVYLVWCRLGNIPHHINAILIGDKPYNATNWLVIEPQKDYYWPINEAPYLYTYPLIVSGFPTNECPFACMYILSPDNQPQFFRHSIDWQKPSTFADWLYERFVKEGI